MIQAGDLVTWLAPLAEKDYLSDMCHRLSKDEKRYYGEFFLRGSVPVDQLVAVYGMEKADPALEGLTVEALFERHFGQQTVVGDTIRLSGLKLRARTVEKGRAILIGIKLPK